MGSSSNPDGFSWLLGIIHFFKSVKMDLEIMLFGLWFAGKKGVEGFEGSGEASGHISGSASEEPGRCDSEVYAGAAPSSSQS